MCNVKDYDYVELYGCRNVFTVSENLFPLQRYWCPNLRSMLQIRPFTLSGEALSSESDEFLSEQWKLCLTKFHPIRYYVMKWPNFNPSKHFWSIQDPDFCLKIDCRDIQSHHEGFSSSSIDFCSEKRYFNSVKNSWGLIFSSWR